jgi:hypothetical protein
MNDCHQTTSPPQDADIYYRLFHALIDSLPSPAVLIHRHSAELFNQAFLDFHGVSSLREFTREFGDLPSRFVPHEAYFHAGKSAAPQQWLEALEALPEAERIVSMINSRAEPHAFAVSVERSVPEYAVLTFTDISQELVKRIMIENDASIDRASGAYRKEYFIHTAKGFEDAATFNKLRVGVTAIEFECADPDEDARNIASAIKNSTRQNDMLVRWGACRYLLVYLTDKRDNIRILSNKLLQLLHCEFPSARARFTATLQQEGESLEHVVERAESALKASEPSCVRMV